MDSVYLDGPADAYLQAKIMSSLAAHAHEPGLFKMAALPAIKKLLAKAVWTIDDVDLLEINEAFVVLAMTAARELDNSNDKLNVNSGATAIAFEFCLEQGSFR